ncbi:hypothetical protein N9X61_01200 [Sulfurimonas sp.]|nr:hypothetical protein [Sulfurimonas sp.]
MDTYLIGAGVGLLGIGIGIGYKIAEKKTDVRSEDFFCTLAHFSQPTSPMVIFKNGKKTSTTCSSFIEKNNKCVLTNDDCIIFKNFDYKTKYAKVIEKLKN